MSCSKFQNVRMSAASRWYSSARSRPAEKTLAHSEVTTTPCTLLSALRSSSAPLNCSRNSRDREFTGLRRILTRLIPSVSLASTVTSASVAHPRLAEATRSAGAARAARAAKRM